MQTRHMPLEEAKPRLGQMRRVLKSVFDRFPSHTLKPRTAIMGMLTLGTLLEGLHRKAAAQATYREGLQIEPENEELLIAYAHSLLETKPEVADEIFEALVDRGTKYFLAYLFAARNAGENGEYEKCMRLSQYVLTLSQNPYVLAQAYEFTAISELELNGPTNKAEDFFQRALNAAPPSERLRENYNIFLGAKTASATQPHKDLSLQSLYERYNNSVEVEASFGTGWYTLLNRASRQPLTAGDSLFSGQLAMAVG